MAVLQFLLDHVLLHFAEIQQFRALLDLRGQLKVKLSLGLINLFSVPFEHLAFMLPEITADFSLSFVPVFIEGGLRLLVAVHKFAMLLLVPMMHFDQHPIRMLLLKLLDFDPALLGLVVLAIGFVHLHDLGLVVQILFYLLKGAAHSINY
jgi:hypothetical protein